MILILVLLQNTFVFAQNKDSISAPYVIVDKLALDLDGSKHAYHPNDEGIDYNSNGGINKQEATTNTFSKKRGYGIAKKISADMQWHGYLQPDGYFVSQTTPYFKNKPDSTPEHYADAEVMPYIAISPNWKARKIKLGDIAYIVNPVNGKTAFAIFADSRNNDDAIEISLALAKALNIPVETKNVFTYDKQKKVTKYTGIAMPKLKIYYFVGSGNGNGKTPEEIIATGKKYLPKM